LKRANIEIEKKMLQKMMNHHEDVMNATIGGIQQRAQKVTVSNERG
jgi:hypothetical protein